MDCIVRIKTTQERRTHASDKHGDFMANDLNNKNDTHCNSTDNKIKELSLSLKTEKTKFAIASDCVKFGIWKYDIAEKTMYQFKKLNGRYSDDLSPLINFRETYIGYNILYPEDTAIFNDFCDALDSGKDDIRYDIRSYDDDYNLHWLRYIGHAVCDDNGVPFCIVGSTADVTDEYLPTQNNSDELDPLTGLLVRDHAILAAAKKLRSRSMDMKPALYIFDIDNFKAINERWGRIYGDYVIETFAKIISVSISDNDVSGRLGGDEFIVLKMLKKDEDPQSFFRTINGRFNFYKFPRGGNFHVSAGCSVFSGNINFDELFKRADMTLYHVKRSTDKNFEVFTHSIESGSETGETVTKNYSDSEEPTYVYQLKDSERKIFDYLFDTFNRCSDPQEAAKYIFPELGKYYGLDSIYISEKDPFGKIKITNQWYNTDIKPIAPDFVEFYRTSWKTIEKYFLENEYYSITLSDPVSEQRKSTMRRYGISAFIRFPFFDGADMVGIISYVREANGAGWSEEEVSALSTITKMFSAYLIKFKSSEKLDYANYYTSAVLDNQQLTAYAIDPNTFDITYTSIYAVNSFPDIEVGKKCYKSIMGCDKPCKNCPALLMKDGRKRAELESYNEKYNKWFGFTVSRIRKPDSNDENYLVCINDITNFIERVNSKDTMTGLLTFERFSADAGKIIAGTTPYAVVGISIDKFRSINEKNGLRIGNLILTEFAEKLKGMLEDGEYGCRWGGGKFLMLLKYKDSADIASRVKKLMDSASADIFSLYGMSVTFLAGYYVLTENDNSLSAAVDKARVARKSLGSDAVHSENRLAVYDQDMDRDAERRKDIESIMNEALNNHEFKVYYQPKVRLSDGKIVGAEALVRWIRPDGQIISPGSFVPVFEENGFICEMDFEIYRQVFEDIKKWQAESIEVPVISVNVSRRHFLGDGFPQKIEELINSYGIDHKYVELEITESMFSSNINHIIDIVNVLRGYGFQISVDDFGTGFSTLNLITMLPVDVLKVDGGFFMNHRLSDKDKAVISSIITLAHKLNLTVVSEGIENEFQVHFLNESGCDTVQGYYFYKPMEPKRFEELIAK